MQRNCGRTLNVILFYSELNNIHLLHTRNKTDMSKKTERNTFNKGINKDISLTFL